MRGKDRRNPERQPGRWFPRLPVGSTDAHVGPLPGRHLRGHVISELDVLQSAFRAAGGQWSTFIIWAKNTFTLGRADYQRQYRTDPLRLARGWIAALVRRSRSGRCLAHQQAAQERSAPDHEAGRTGRAGDPQFQSTGRYRAGLLRRLWHHDDCRREVKPQGPADRTGSEVRGCDCASLAGLCRGQATRQSDGVAFDAASGVGESRVEVAAADVGDVGHVRELTRLVGDRHAAD